MESVYYYRDVHAWGVTKYIYRNKRRIVCDHICFRMKWFSCRAMAASSPRQRWHVLQFHGLCEFLVLLFFHQHEFVITKFVGALLGSEHKLIYMLFQSLHPYLQNEVLFEQLVCWKKKFFSCLVGEWWLSSKCVLVMLMSVFFWEQDISHCQCIFWLRPSVQLRIIMSSLYEIINWDPIYLMGEL